jgi:hypothetical protein
MKPTKSPGKRSSPKPAAKSEAKAVMEQQIELDRRGKPLPPRQRVGGIITPQ